MRLWIWVAEMVDISIAALGAAREQRKALPSRIRCNAPLSCSRARVVVSVVYAGSPGGAWSTSATDTGRDAVATAASTVDSSAPGLLTLGLAVIQLSKLAPRTE